MYVLKRLKRDYAHALCKTEYLVLIKSTDQKAAQILWNVSQVLNNTLSKK